MSKTSIVNKLILGFGAVSFVMVASTVLSITQMRSTVSGLETLTSVPLKKERMLSLILKNSAVGLRRNLAIASTNDPNLVKAFGDDLKVTTESSNKLTKELEPLLTTDDEKKAYVYLKEKRIQYLKYRDAIIEARKNHEKEEKIQQMVETDFKPSSQLYIQAAENLVTLEQKSIDNEKSRLISEAHTQMNLAWGGLVIALGFSIIAIYLVARSIKKPIDKTLSVLESLAKGDLTYDYDQLSDGGDEMSRILQATAKMSKEMSSMVSSIQIQAQKINEHSTVLSKRSQIALKDAQDQVQLASHVSSGVDKAKIIMEQTSKMGLEGKTIVKQSGSMAKQGEQAISSLGDEINKVEAIVKQAASVAVQLGENAQKITGIAASIKAVADQTNLLSLNAAIEAARAGEAGRGFAVVADEVGKLAAKAAASAQQIDEITSLVGQSVLQMCQKMDSSVKAAEEGTRKAKESSHLFGRINQVALIAEHSAEKISDGISEQVKASEEAGRGIYQVSQLIEKSQIAIQEVSSTAESLAHIAHSLLEESSRFKV